MDIISTVLYIYQSTGSLCRTANITKMGLAKVRKILITAGHMPTPRTEEIQTLLSSGLDKQAICKRLNINSKTLNNYLPYVRPVYNIDNPSENAQKIRSWRKKKQDKSED